MIADSAVLLGAAIVSLGYASTALFFVLDRRQKKMLVDCSLVGPASAASFVDDGDGRRGARFSLGRARLSIGDQGVQIDLPGSGPSGTPVHASLRGARTCATPIGAVVPIDGGYASATEKRLVLGQGEVVAAGQRFVLDAPVCALDHTAGFLARHTAWRWALGAGFAASGERVAFNLVEGFVGAAECGLWVDDELFPCDEGAFEYDLDVPERPWRVRSRCGAVDVSFSPAAMHREQKNLVVVRSQFIQPAGEFSGVLRVKRREIAVAALPGVTEHQDVRW